MKIPIHTSKRKIFWKQAVQFDLFFQDLNSILLWILLLRVDKQGSFCSNAFKPLPFYRTGESVQEYKKVAAYFPI